MTVIVPAHDERELIRGTLRAVAEGISPGDKADIVVVCNGCSDDTAEQARLASPHARIIELDVGSKTNAINAALQLSRDLPVIIVDADVMISKDGLSAIARILELPNVLAASPIPQFDVSGCDIWVRAYYRARRRHPYLKAGVGGSGVYGISTKGIAEIGTFPPIIADDGFVRAKFPLFKQRRIESADNGDRVYSVVKCPLGVGDLIRCEARWRAGDLQLRETLKEKAISLESASDTDDSSLIDIDTVIYAGIRIAGRILHRLNRLRGTSLRWRRDDSRRARQN